MPYSESPKLHYSCPIFSTVAAIIRASPDPHNDTPQERTVPWSNHWLSTFNLGWQKAHTCCDAESQPSILHRIPMRATAKAVSTAIPRKQFREVVRIIDAAVSSAIL